MRHAISCLLLSCAALAGCSAGTEPTEADYDDVAAGLGSLTADDAGDAHAMGDAVVMLRGDLPFGLTTTARGSIEGLHGGLMFEYALTCRDADGAAMAVCTSETDSGSLSASFSGELTTATFSGAISRSGEWNVSGLTTDVATFDGSGSFDVDAEWVTLFGATRSYRLAYDASYAGIGVRTEDGVVVRGEARMNVVAERMASRGSNEAEAELHIEAVIDYHGDGTATLTLDGLHRYAVTLASGHVERE